MEPAPRRTNENDERLLRSDSDATETCPCLLCHESPHILREDLDIRPDSTCLVALVFRSEPKGPNGCHTRSFPCQAASEVDDDAREDALLPVAGICHPVAAGLPGERRPPCVCHQADRDSRPAIHRGFPHRHQRRHGNVLRSVFPLPLFSPSHTVLFSFFLQRCFTTCTTMTSASSESSPTLCASTSTWCQQFFLKDEFIGPLLTSQGFWAYVTFPAAGTEAQAFASHLAAGL
jgi:hypothetical protein